MPQLYPDLSARAGLLPGGDLPRSYDSVVCGAGSAGSVVAGRLAANLDVAVLLLEAGGSDDVPAVLDPDQWPANLGSDREWGFTAAPSPHVNGHAIPYAMGRVLGGGASINVTTWARGHRADWDLFAEAAGDPAWGDAAVRDVYRRVEGGPASGGAGPMWVQPTERPHALAAAALDAMAACGLHRFPEMNGALWEAPDGCAVVDQIVHDDRRQSPFRSFVWPRLGQPNLTVLTGAEVTRVRFVGNRAVGVEFTHDGRSECVDAGLAVVLSLGALQTPKVLMQSGVGDAVELGQFGIPLVQHLPAVGRHLHDHVAIACAWEAPAAAELPVGSRPQAVGFWRTDRALPANTMAPCVVVGQRAADLLAAEHGH
ncbi:MAG TPA: GMC family oxidoreductase [Gemmatirosa sp.]